MSLLLRDGGVNELARQVQSVTNAKSKIEAVRNALVHELERAKLLKDEQNFFGASNITVRGPAADELALYMQPFMDKMWAEIGYSAAK